MSKNEEVEQYLSKKRNDVVFQVEVLLVLAAIVSALIAFGIQSYYRGQAIENLGAALNNQRQQVIDCADETVPTTTEDCSTPVAPPAEDIIEDAPGPVGPIGPMGPEGREGPQGPGPTESQIATAVITYCASGVCDGKRPTATQVAAAVTAYCGARGDCIGTPGVSGQDGEDGATGEQGPPPSAEQIASAVATYCESRNNCVGQQGETGDQGPQGPAGVVSTSVDPSCDPVDGQVIDSVRLEYSADSKDIRVVCTQTTTGPLG